MKILYLFLFTCVCAYIESALYELGYLYVLYSNKETRSIFNIEFDNSFADFADSVIKSNNGAGKLYRDKVVSIMKDHDTKDVNKLMNLIETGYSVKREDKISDSILDPNLQKTIKNSEAMQYNAIIKSTNDNLLSLNNNDKKVAMNLANKVLEIRFNRYKQNLSNINIDKIKEIASNLGVDNNHIEKMETDIKKLKNDISNVNYNNINDKVKEQMNNLASQFKEIESKAPNKAGRKAIGAETGYFNINHVEIIGVVQDITKC